MQLSKTHELIKANFKRAKILVIEDNADHWTLIERAIQQCLPEIIPVWVSTPSEALAFLDDCSFQEWEMPKLILQDLYLPNQADGQDLLLRIKAMPAPCNLIPILILSSSNDRADIIESYLHGSSSYLVKPTDYEDWVAYFQELRTYWWETVTLPPLHFSV